MLRSNPRTPIPASLAERRLFVGGALAALIAVLASIGPSLSASAAYTPPKPGVGPKGLTSKRVCTLVTPAQQKALLDGQDVNTQVIGVNHGSPQQNNPGQAACTWSDEAGNNVTLAINGSPAGPSSCPTSAISSPVRTASWKGCWSTAQGLSVDKGIYALSITYQSGGGAVPAKLKPVMEAVATSVLKQLRA